MSIIRIVGIGLVAAACTILSACSGTVTMKVTCNLSTLKCKPSATITGPSITLARPLSQGPHVLTSQIPDASQFSISTAGSTIEYPATGQVTISLLSGGTLEAAKTFPWVRNGTLITLQDPAAVNAWAETAAPSASKLAYTMVPFSVASQLQEGTNVVKQTSYYQGAEMGSASATITCRSPSGGLPSQVASIGEGCD